MAYSVLERLKKLNERKYTDHSLEAEAISFIRNRCEGLRFDITRSDEDGERKAYTGKSIEINQIPYNMEKDIDRLCMENAIARFLESGKKEDAFDVYFCYLEMFVGDYEKTRRMIELLSEFEANGSGLLMKHRDHYSHSVYVFCLGLAIYESNSVYRDRYAKKYEKQLGDADENQKAHHFLKYWGLTSLFHDIGYPFELPFEQVASYFEVAGDDRSKRPFVAYNGIESFTKINKTSQRKIGAIFNLGTDKIIDSTDKLFAYALHRTLGDTYYFSEQDMYNILLNKPTKPNQFGYFMDHAYFSATVLFRKLFEEIKISEMTEEYIDSLTAILLHNSLYKFGVAFYKDPDVNIQLKTELHPLAYMLMLCDELQCWDRTAYGRNSKKELHPMNCRFDFSNNTIKATYIFDKSEEGKIKKYEEELQRDSKAKMKAYDSYIKTERVSRLDSLESVELNKFQADIERIVDLRDIKLEVLSSIEEKPDVKKKESISSSRFLNLYTFAVILNGRWGIGAGWREKVNTFNDGRVVKQLEKEFGNLSLEYKLSNINQAKAFGSYLQKIGCFYTDEAVNFEMVERFSVEDLIKIGPMEHQRWLQERYDMGWRYGDPATKDERELLRIHKDMIPTDDDIIQVSIEIAKTNYNRLKKEEQDKDTEPMECMLALLKLYDGLRIYRLQ